MSTETEKLIALMVDRIGQRVAATLEVELRQAAEKLEYERQLLDLFNTGVIVDIGEAKKRIIRHALNVLTAQNSKDSGTKATDTKRRGASKKN